MNRTLRALCFLAVLSAGCSFLNDYDEFAFDPDAGAGGGSGGGVGGGAGGGVGGGAGGGGGPVCTPGAMELCNGVDDDCDDAVDEAPLAACTLPHASTTTCTAGECAVVGCAIDYDDCGPAAGCETDVRVSHAHCGGCLAACDGDQVCAASACKNVSATWAVWITGSNNFTNVQAARSGEAMVVALDSQDALTVTPESGAALALVDPTGANGFARDALIFEVTENGAIGDSCLLDAGQYITIHDIATDSAGNTYVAGSFSQGNINVCGIGTLNVTTGSDGFLLSFDTNMDLRFAAAFNGDGNQTVDAVHVSAGGAILVAGSFATELKVNGVLRSGAATAGSFIARIDATGFYQDGYGFAPGPYRMSLASDSAGNVYLFSKVEGDITVEGTAYSANFHNFMLSVDADLDFRWADMLNDAGNLGGEEFAMGGAASSNGRIHAFGGCYGPIDLGGGDLTDGSYLGTFLGGGTSPVHDWSRSWPKVFPVHDVSVDDDGNVFVAGQLTSSVVQPDLGGGPLTPIGGSDAVVISLTSTGEYRWAKVFGSADFDEAQAVLPHPSGEITVLGNYREAFTIDSETAPAPGANGSHFLIHFAQDP